MNSHLMRYDKSKRLLFFDLETFNLQLSWYYNRPWQCGMIEMQGGKVLAEHDHWIKWNTDLKIGAGAAAATHFNQAKFDRLAVPFEQCADNIYRCFEEADFLIGHNILGFDIYMVYELYKQMGKPYDHLVDKMIDTLSLGRMYKLKLNKPKDTPWIQYQYKLQTCRQKRLGCTLEGLGKEFKIPFDSSGLHDAVNDLRLNVEVWKNLINVIEI